MDAELKREILKHIANITFNVQPFDEVRQPGRSRSIFVTKERGTEVKVILAGEYYEEYDDLLKLLLEKAKWNEKVSQQYLDSRLKNLIATIREDNRAKEVQDLAPYLNQLIVDLDSFETQTAYIPVLGIKTDIHAFPVGNFTLKRYTRGLANELVEKCRKSCSLEDSEPSQESKIKSFRKSLNRFKNTIVAERRFDYPIEAGRALEIAEEELRRVIDLFRYVIAWIYPDRPIEKRPLIGLQGEIRLDARLTFTFSNASVHTNEKAMGLVHPFYLSTFDLYDFDDLERSGFFLMSDVLSKPPEKLTPYQEVLIRGLRLFSDSQTQFERENEYLGMFNCIENFVAPGERLRDNISKTIAFLVANVPDEREQKRIEFQKKYDTRSKITHGSRHVVILDDDLKALRRAALDVIGWMIHQDEKFVKPKELRRRLKKERLKIWSDDCVCEK
ncbi:MAG: hypothetical protein WAL97_09980 [Halobacteriota archaeon]